jgi:two-component system cell cycle response regulator
MAADENGYKILVIEDNPLNLKLVRDLIRIHHYEVLDADNAETGVELARLHQPDLILMDIELPGISGLEATRLIRQDSELSGIPVLALSANAMEEDKAKALAAGCDDYITKPIGIKSFPKTIHRYLPKPAGSKRPTETTRGHRILIVDDDALNIKLLAAQLTTKGYRIATAADGRTALDRVATDPPDLILLDIMMPGIDGYEVTKRLKANAETRDIPIILVTALTGDDEKERGLEVGADEFINKPVNYPELEARVTSLLRLKEYQDQLGSRKESASLMAHGLVESENDKKEDADLPTVLIVEDDATSAKLIARYLSMVPCKLEIVDNGEKALRAVSSNPVDIMLLDLMLPTIDGIQVCKTIKSREQTIPIQVVMITSLTDTKSKLMGIEAGTDDFLVKPINKDELRARVKSLLKKKAYLDRLRAKVDGALYAAITDKLTGVYNQGYFKHFIELEIKRAKRHRHRLTLLMVDVDDFKKFNDRYGHQCGDQALHRIAEKLKSNIRDIDLIARYGGEEFSIILPYADLPAAEAIARRLLQAVSDGCEIEHAPDASLSVSIGISIYPDFCDTPAELLKTADLALYRAKNKGKNRYRIFQKTDTQPITKSSI